MSKVSEILRRRAERKAKLEKCLEAIVDQLKDMGALKIILFGSLARDEVDVHSDLDLLVIMPSTKNGKEWMEKIYQEVERKVASNIIVYNLDEFEKKLPLSSFLQNVLKGRVIYEKAAVSIFLNRFKNTALNKYHVLRSLTYFEDAEFEPDPVLIGECKYQWAEVKNFFIKNIK